MRGKRDKRKVTEKEGEVRGGEQSGVRTGGEKKREKRGGMK